MKVALDACQEAKWKLFTTRDVPWTFLFDVLQAVSFTGANNMLPVSRVGALLFLERDVI